MMSLPRFPLNHEKWTDTVEELVPLTSRGSWSGYPAPNSDDPLLGQTLNGTYVVESVIGEGGMGRVYRASHTRIANKRFAIKVLRSEFSSSTEMVARFRREAEAAACITHPNVVGVYDVDETPERCSYIVCEYLEGIDLSEYLGRIRQLPLPAAIHIVRQVCSALESAHAAGVMHRDVKPQNIFLLTGEQREVQPQPEVKVLDFGLSRFVDAVGTQLTRAGVIMGTPAYMAPEQAGGGAVDYRTDIYGLGAVLYAVITGSPPYDGETLQDVVLAVLNQEPPLPRTLNPDIPPNLELLIQRAMARNPDERYQSMAEFGRALDAFVEPPSQAALPSPALPARQASRLALEAEAREVRMARPRLVIYTALSLVLLILGLASIVPSIEQVTGRLRFTRTESSLILLVIVGTLLTPAVLFFRHIKRSVWGNHARVLDSLKSIQFVLLAALGAYGTAALAVHCLDDVLGRFTVSSVFGKSPVTGFRGWNIIFIAIALTGATLTIYHRRMARPQKPAARWARAGLPAIGLLLASLFISSGFLWRAKVVRAEVAQAKAIAAAAATAAAANAKSTTDAEAAPFPIDADSAPTKAAIERAPVEELAQASAKGASGLIQLAERYTRDPYVLKPLLFAYASRSTGLADAVTIAQRLFDVAPEEIRDPDIRFLIRKAANTPGETSIIAFSLMVEHMGTAGPDLLYDLMLNNSRLSKHADELLTSESVRKVASPALRVAYELRKADSCAARVPLLERASELGDVRSVQILSPYTVGAKRGCGRWKRGPCPPPCPAEARRYTEAIARIMSRMPGGR